MPRTHRGDEVGDNHSNARKQGINYYNIDYQVPTDYPYADYEPDRLIETRGRLRGERLG